jgi:hypothetical protein
VKRHDLVCTQGVQSVGRTSVVAELDLERLAISENFDDGANLSGGQAMFRHVCGEGNCVEKFNMVCHTRYLERT